MNKEEMTDAIVSAKKSKGLKWENIATNAGMSTSFITSVCLGMNTATEEVAKKICGTLSLGDEVCTTLQEFPYKEWSREVPTDPVIYRLYEMIGVYGPTIKEIIHEQCGDGIMSAIDFNMDVQKEDNSKGDRVVITLSGKFLKYSSW
ncbi:MAG: cyanase [Gammaproteobacteria bacterium]